MYGFDNDNSFHISVFNLTYTLLNINVDANFFQLNLRVLRDRQEKSIDRSLHPDTCHKIITLFGIAAKREQHYCMI
jgi:hypothetical protein